MGEVGVGGARDHLAPDLGELGRPFGVGDDFRGTHEREVQGVEEEDHIFAFVVVQADFFECT